MSSGSQELQPAPAATVASPAQEEKLHPEWQDWIVANILAGVEHQHMVAAMVSAGFPEDFAQASIHEYEENPIVNAARRAAAVHLKATDILDALCRLERQSPAGKHIDVVKDLPAARFYHDYFFRNRPVVLQGLISDWKAMRLWTPAYFAEHFGDCEVEITAGRGSDHQHECNFDEHKARLLMREYVRMVEEGGETNDYYLVAQNYLLANPGFRELYGHITGLDGYFDASSMRGRVRLWFGPRGTVTRFHHDAAPVMMAQIYGRKSVKLISPYNLGRVYSGGDWIMPVDPENLDYARYPLMRDVDILEVTLNPGDLLFVPLGWWHWVKSLEVSISLSLDNFIVPRSTIEIAW